MSTLSRQKGQAIPPNTTPVTWPSFGTTMSEEDRIIVLAMDGSEYSEYAFQWYLNNMRRPVDHIVIVHCPEYHNIAYAQAPVMSDVSLITQMIHEEEGRAREMVDTFGQKLKDNGLRGKVRSIGGKPGEVICKVADEEKACMIITGTRGLGKVRRTFVGSISDYVLHHSHVPVIVCRHKDHHKHHGSHSGQ
ncbi:universal stress protein Sll1388-like [Haliotis rufescens]|uniref:universal stress protein Sll1388-like n=1 Tax=Haliotis rufescens TaxID=6454 RepID=UPI00201FA63F|nr:universal stress protein Sll1388-like [Haliotis rufescens]